MAISADQITAVILAGGLSRRMGQDKALVHYQGLPLYQHVRQNIQPHVKSVWINYNGAQASSFAGMKSVEDDRAGYLGPLAGIEAALRQITTPYLLCLPCDMPVLPYDLTASLSQVMTKQDCDLVVAKCGTQVYPVIALMKRCLLALVEQQLDAKQYRMMDWVHAASGHYAAFENCENFKNCNTHDDLNG